MNLLKLICSANTSPVPVLTMMSWLLANRQLPNISTQKYEKIWQIVFELEESSNVPKYLSDSVSARLGVEGGLLAPMNFVTLSYSHEYVMLQGKKNFSDVTKVTN